MDAFSSRPVSRASLLIDHLLEESKCPDILFLQEVTSAVCTYILDNTRIREAFLVTDAEDHTSFDGVPFANMKMLSRKRFAVNPGDPDKLMLGQVCRIAPPSKYEWRALSVDIIAPAPSSPSTFYRLINVHLDSLGDRPEQMQILAQLLRDPGCVGGFIAGDFNAVSLRDHELLDENGLVDAWAALHGQWGGATWVQAGMDSRINVLEPSYVGRLDKVALLGSIEAEGMEVLPSCLIEVPKPGAESDHIPCSDHHALRFVFTV